MKVLIICIGNSCRSQMAEGFIHYKFPEIEVYSAGTNPANEVNPNSVKVMSEIGYDISNQKPTDVEEYKNIDFDLVITVCDSAKENCPVFSGKVGKMIHTPFEDPYMAKGTEEEILMVYRKVRDQIEEKFDKIFG
jgi:arsenate reductase